MQRGQLCLIYSASIIYTGQCHGEKGRTRYTEEWRVDGVHSGERECERKRKKMSEREREWEGLCVRNLIVQISISLSPFFFYPVSCSENTFPPGTLSLNVPIFKLLNAWIEVNRNAWLDLLCTRWIGTKVLRRAIPCFRLPNLYECICFT